MRKALSGALVCLCLLAGAGWASADKRPLHYGPILGLSLAKQSEEDFENSFRLGFSLGGFLTYSFNDRLSLTGQFLFGQKGYRYADTDTFGPYTSNLVLNYLEVPVLVRCTFGSNALRPYVFAGPALGIKLCGKYSTTWIGRSYESTDMSHYKGTDLGLVLGAGLGYPLGVGRLLFDARFTWGLLDIYKSLEAETGGDDYRISNAVFLFAFSYVFGRS